jgi:DNA-binding response OmpR family regulator
MLSNFLSPKPPRTGTPSVRRLALLVEDDPSMQEAVALHLGRMNFEVLSALHYDDAVQHLTARRPDLVLVDLGLPTRSGYELCEYIRGPFGQKRLPILVTSGSGFAEDLANAEIAGANAFLQKPFSMHQLTGYIEALLAPVPKSEPYMRRLQL